MKEITSNTNERNPLALCRKAKTLYLAALIALLAASAIGYLPMPTGGTVSAQAYDRDVRNLITIEQPQKRELAAAETIGGAQHNRANDFAEFGLVKVCKIAGPGIPLNTNFTFRVIGRGFIDAAGTIGDVDRTIQVGAGMPNEGGICGIVPGFGAGAGNAEFQSFVTGTNVTITENPAVVSNGQIRVSRIRSSSTASRPSEFVVIAAVSQDITEVEYTNFLFRPTFLKICKAAASPELVGQPFTFTTTLISPTGAGGNLFPPFSATTTVIAGPSNQGGNCNIVDGGGLIGGAFNQGSTVTITEDAAAGTFVSNITSPTSTIPAFIPGARSTTLSGDQGIVEGVTQVTFTNSSNPNPPVCMFSISPSQLIVSSSAGSGSFTINTSPVCIWTVVSNASWITITSAVNGLGNGTVNFSFTANTQSDVIRVGTISVGGQTFTVQQGPAPCTFTFPSNGTNVSASGGSVSVSVNTQIACPWTAVSNSPWITFNSAPGWGSGAATFTVQANAGPERTGTITIRALNGTPLLIFTVVQAGTVNSRTAFDFDGDGKADVSVFRPSNGAWYLNRSQTGFYAGQWGASTDQIVPGDYDGDGKTDLAVFRKSANSTWYILHSANNTFRAAQWGATNLEQQLLLSDRAAPGDYDGDGKTDLAVWRLTDYLSEPARFVILQSSTNTGTARQWGGFGDAPVQAADYDGDGRADLTVRRGSVWYILQSQTNDLRAVQFGLISDKAVPADYDGDGKADVAVVRDGTWYLQRSRDGFLGYQFGLSTDLPAPADYDGDGKTDVAVYRDGIWYLQRSQLGFTGIAFGAATDKPIPNSFIP